MKTKLLLSLLLLVCLERLSAQNYNMARHSQEDYTSNAVSINSKVYYLESSRDDSLNIVTVSNNGQVPSRIPINQAGNVSRVVKIGVSLDKKLLIMYRDFGTCDTGPDIVRFRKHDTTGAFVFQLSFPMAAGVMDFTQHSDSSFYFYNSGQILHFSKSGQQLPGPNIAGMTSISCIKALSNGNLLINAVESTQRKNLIITPNAGSVYNQTTTHTITSFWESPSGALYGKNTTGNILTYSTNLTLLANSGNVIGLVSVADLQLRNDSVFCTGSIFPGLPWYGILSSTLGVLYQTQSPYQGVTPTGIAVSNQNRVSVISRGTSTANIPMSFGGLHQFPITGSISSKYDVGVTGFTLNSSYTGPYWAFGGYVATLNMIVDVKNFGSDTVRHFYLNHYYGEICTNSLHKRFDLVLPPNAVATVSTGTFPSFVPQGAMTFQGSTYNHSLCLSTSVPNFENDIDIRNDAWCGSVPVPIPLGLEELNNGITASAYPNPAQDKVTLRCSSTLRKIEVMDLSGKAILTQTPNSNEAELSTEEWQRGIYLLRLVTADGTVHKKLAVN